MVEELLNLLINERRLKVTGLSDIVQIEAEVWDQYTHIMLDRSEVQVLRDALDRWLVARPPSGSVAGPPVSETGGGLQSLSD